MPRLSMPQEPRRRHLPGANLSLRDADHARDRSPWLTDIPTGGFRTGPAGGAAGLGCAARSGRLCRERGVAGARPARSAVPARFAPAPITSARRLSISRRHVDGDARAAGANCAASRLERGGCAGAADAACGELPHRPGRLCAAAGARSAHPVALAATRLDCRRAGAASRGFARDCAGGAPPAIVLPAPIGHRLRSTECACAGAAMPPPAPSRAARCRHRHRHVTPRESIARRPVAQADPGRRASAGGTGMSPSALIAAFLEGRGCPRIRSPRRSRRGVPRYRADGARRGGRRARYSQHARFGQIGIPRRTDRAAPQRQQRDEIRARTRNAAWPRWWAPPRPGFLPGSAAMRQSMDDIKIHELALVAAINSVFADLSKQLDPETIMTRARRIRA